MNKKGKAAITAVVVLAAAAAALTWFQMAGKRKEELAPLPPPAVSAAKALIRTIERSADLIGTVEPDTFVNVMPTGTGQVLEVNAQAGGQVTAGQLLLKIDTKQVEASRLSLKTATISYEDAKSNLNRYAALHAAGNISDADFQKMEDNVKIAKIQYESAELGYNTQLNNSRVTAPITGKIESFHVKLHDMVTPQTQICVITGEGEGRSVTFYVSERIAEGLKPGDGLKVMKNGAELEAAITETGTMADPSSGLFKVKAAVFDAGALAAGTSVKLRVISQRAENVLAVPVNSVYYQGGDPYIYTYADGVLYKKAVKLGIADSNYIEVKEGVEPEDLVVNTWTTELYDGSKVSLIGEDQSEDQTENQPENQPEDQTGAGPESRPESPGSNG